MVQLKSLLRNPWFPNPKVHTSKNGMMHNSMQQWMQQQYTKKPVNPNYYAKVTINPLPNSIVFHLAVGKNWRVWYEGFGL